MKPGSLRGPLSEEHKMKLRFAHAGQYRGGKRLLSPRATPNPSKVCRKCNIEKPIEQFKRHALMRDGHLNQCRTCAAEWTKQRRIERYGSLLEARRAMYGRELQTGSMTRIAPQKYGGKDKAARRRAVIRYSHKRRSQTALTLELDVFAMDEAMALREMRTDLTGGRWAIDHIVPLNHRKVCGLHTALNLQVVPHLWNVQKKNLHTQSYFPAVWMGR